MEAPDLIRQVHLDYLRAGADIITTASYQASFEGFARLGLSELEATRLFQLSVLLASEARDEFVAEMPVRNVSPGPLVAASLGSYGAYLADGSEYSGNYGLTPSQLKSFHRKRVEALLEASPDLLAFETVPCQMEGEVITELMEEFSHAKAWLSFSCRDEARVCHGELFSECVKSASCSHQIVAVGLNCTSPEFVEPLLGGVGAGSSKYLIAYPNSGEGWDTRNRRWIPADQAFDFGALARRWYAAGARLIGGCCRTTPNHIRSIRMEFSRVRPAG